METVDVPEEPRSPSVQAFVMLMLEQPCRILTIRDERYPQLPCFTYDQRVRSYTPELCCKDMAETLGLPSHPEPFRVLAEIIPPKNDDTLCSLRNPNGAYRALLVDTTGTIDLNAVTDAHAKEHPENAAGLTSVCSFRDDVLFNRKKGKMYRFTRAAMRVLVHPCGRAQIPLSKRCAHTQIHEGIDFLQEFIRGAGWTPKRCVQRHEWDSLAPVFKVETDQGWHYIKLPTPGTAEASITKCIASLFPEDTLVVEATDVALSCFISKEFVRTSGIWKPAAEFQRIGARRLARIQLLSLEHLETLKESGLPDYCPSALSTKIDELAASKRFSPHIQSDELSLEYVTTTMKRFCDELDNSGIPNTLVHGDFSVRNCGVRGDVEEDRGVILYDWEGSCLSHPFCDMYSLLDEWWNERFQDEYFPKWSRYVNIEEARRYARVGRVVGAVVRMCHLLHLADASVASSREFFLFAVESCAGKLLSMLQYEETKEILRELGL